MSLSESEKSFIKKSSVPLEGGGDTHFHPFGPGESDFVVTTQIPIGNGFTFKDHTKVNFNK